MDSVLRVQRNSVRTKYTPSDKRKSPKAIRKQNMRALVDIRNRYNSDPFYSSEVWLKVRYRVLVKFGRKCALCLTEGLETRYHVDHIKPRSKYPELQLHEPNLQVLCEACNLGKSNLDATDWRPKT